MSWENAFGDRQTVKTRDLEVLVVDDSRHVRRLLRDALSSVDIRVVHEAEDGTEACKLLTGAIAPDLVITDIMMTPLDGFDLLRMIRNGKSAAHPFIPVIMVSGYSGLANVQTASDLGANGFVMKPFTAKDIIAKAKTAILRPPMFVQTATYFGPDRRTRPRPRTGSGDDCQFSIPCPRRYGEYVQAHPCVSESCGQCARPEERCRAFFTVIKDSGYPMSL